MALRQANPNPFEPEDDVIEAEAEAATTTTAEAPAPAPSSSRDVKAWAASQVAVSKPPTSTALAKALQTSTTLDELQNVISPDMLESMSFGAFPRVTVSPGAFQDKDSGKSLGDFMVVELLSWNFVTVVSTGTAVANKETNRLVRTSYDGINLTNGEGLVTAYLEKLRSMDYTKAQAKKYLELYVQIIETGKGGKVPEADRKITQISIPPTSTGPWGAFLLQQRLQAKKGTEVSSIIRLNAESKNDGSNTWGVVDFRAA